MPLIVLKDKNLREIIERAIKVKAKAYRYHIRENLLEESKYVYHEWKALTELADILSVQYNSITEQDNGKDSEHFCLEIIRKNEEVIAIIVPLNLELTKKQKVFLTKILGGTEHKEEWYRIVGIPK